MIQKAISMDAESRFLMCTKTAVFFKKSFCVMTNDEKLIHSITLSTAHEVNPAVFQHCLQN